MRDTDIAPAQASLLAWYDRAARDLPWRLRPADLAAGARPDPYRVWLSEVMLQQTTVAAVKAYFTRFTALWPSVTDLAAAPDASVMAEWAGLGYYARARNLLACARAVACDHAGRFPDTEEGLRALPGIGPYTAAAVAAIAFDRAAVVVDGNVERVVSRLFAVETPIPAASPTLRALAARLTPNQRPGDFAQAMMDLGATICTPRSPACALCPLRPLCAATTQDPASYPRKTPKPAKPIRQGRLWIARRPDGAWLTETRPARGLLGGMTGFPGDSWDGAGPDHPPFDADWQTVGKFRHTFTHFHLDLTVLTTTASANPDRGEWTPAHRLTPSDLPTLMRKALALLPPLSY